ncbi:hypothetical protein [Ehrlichia canis]|uniref:Uncharacterized protein n=1 Tax=Ehrlichia canis (strain Jake) TaxID=269484 RepID=A0ACA6AVI7_EHRCJ|nr:hypothetical protein [Ehrlichia canis]AAZ68353.1 hypothetical protein Ecaj_0309 [Ehrlichia canis str. Jake]AUO54888.1 hypothetical protein C1I72_03310 [Ehrlichia canis]UKC53009.1 hypothetical protein s20019040002_000051 [Ehrlichia canis]UKC53946.1 hypothetical protein s20026770001_000051 [Ehrlichia canis]UKC54882.1 hypothetical protein s21009500007_000051 [Ehrlichia canis]
MLTRDQQREAIDKRKLKQYIKDTVSEKIDDPLLDMTNITPLCVTLLLDVEPDFTLFKEKVIDILKEYNDLIAIHYLPKGLTIVDDRTSEMSWNSVKELHKLYHNHQLSVASNDGSSILTRQKFNLSPNKQDIIIDNNLKYRIQYYLLSSLIDQCFDTETIKTYSEEALFLTDNTRKNIIQKLGEILHHHVQKKTFSSYAKYLKNLYEIQELYFTEKGYDLLSTTLQHITLRKLNITQQNMSYTFSPLLDNGCDININCNIPEYVDIFLETSDITISGTVYGNIFSKYGSITITNAKEDCSKNVVSIFGVVSINGKIINQKLPNELIINSNFCTNIKRSSIITRQTNLCQTPQTISSFSSEDFINNQHTNNIDALKIELFNAKLQYYAIIASIEWPTKQPTYKNAELLFQGKIQYTDIIDKLCNINQNTLPNIRIDHSINLPFHNVFIKDKKLIIEKLNKFIGVYLTTRTNNGKDFIKKFHIDEIAIHSQTEYAQLILYNTNITIFGKFQGLIHTHTGNITVIGEIKKSRLTTNTGLIRIKPSNSNANTTIASDSLIIAKYGTIEITGKHNYCYINGNKFITNPDETSSATTSLNKTHPQTSTKAITSQNSTKHAIPFSKNTIHYLNHVNIIDNIEAENRLPITFFDYGATTFIHDVHIKDKKLILRNLNNNIALHLTNITSNGTNLKSKFGVNEVVIYSDAIEHAYLIFHDTDVTIIGSFFGILHTNRGNIKINGEIKKLSKISTNAGSIEITGKVNKAEITANTGSIEIKPHSNDLTTEVAINSPLTAKYGTVKITGIHSRCRIDGNHVITTQPSSCIPHSCLQKLSVILPYLADPLLL